MRAASGGKETEDATSGAAMVKLQRSANETLTTDGIRSTEEVVSARDAASAIDAAANETGSTKDGGSAKIGLSMESFVSTSDVASRTLGCSTRAGADANEASSNEAGWVEAD
jgi:hypothetical protein